MGNAKATLSPCSSFICLNEFCWFFDSFVGFHILPYSLGAITESRPIIVGNRSFLQHLGQLSV